MSPVTGPRALRLRNDSSIPGGGRYFSPYRPDLTAYGVYPALIWWVTSGPFFTGKEAEVRLYSHLVNEWICTSTPRMLCGTPTVLP